MTRVVLDSNVWISALLFGGNPRAIAELAEAGHIECFTSRAIIGEIEETLWRKFEWSETRIRDAAAMMGRGAIRVAPGPELTDCPDPDDNRVLECAVGARAQFLVTGDRHLLMLHPYRAISIVTSRQFLDAAPWLPV